MECMCEQTRPWFILSSERVGGGGGGGEMEPETMLVPREKSPLLEAQRRFEPATHRTARPTHYRLSCSCPSTRVHSAVGVAIPSCFFYMHMQSVSALRITHPLVLRKHFGLESFTRHPSAPPPLPQSIRRTATLLKNNGQLFLMTDEEP